MPVCPQCGATIDSTQPDVERCAECGCFLPAASQGSAAESAGTVQPSIPSIPSMADTSIPESATPAEPLKSSDSTTPPTKRSSELLIKPRNLSPEYAARVTAHWEGTHSEFKNPNETIHSNAAVSEEEAGLIIGMRNIVGVEDEN